MKKLAVAFALLASALVATTMADTPSCNQCCSQCGCGQCVKKVCRLKCEPKKETKWVYSVVCEDFCLPGPSTKCGYRCVPDCTECDGHRKEIVWKPSCGKILTKKKLVKRPVTIEKPHYHCEVVCICKGCGCRHVDEKATAEYEATGILPVGAEFEEVDELPELAQPANEAAPVATEEETPAPVVTAGSDNVFSRLFRR